MRRITSFEIRCLKELLKIYRARIFQREQQIINLELENEELRKQLEESRAKEGKGILESTIDGMCKAFNNIDFSSLLSQKSIEEYTSTMNQEDVENDTM